jgi:hypothetical protein
MSIPGSFGIDASLESVGALPLHELTVIVLPGICYGGTGNCSQPETSTSPFDLLTAIWKFLFLC